MTTRLDDLRLELRPWLVDHYDEPLAEYIRLLEDESRHLLAESWRRADANRALMDAIAQWRKDMAADEANSNGNPRSEEEGEK